METLTIPDKPLAWQPCNGCGVCCIAVQCPASVKVFGRAQVCPALEWDEGRFWCGLMRHPQQYGAGIPELDKLSTKLNATAVYYQGWLGADIGCDSEVMELEIKALIPKFLEAAQEVYDEWEQDENGYDFMHGTGGICDSIADAILDVVTEHTRYETQRHFCIHEWHASALVYSPENREVYQIDIPYHVYETGDMYVWTKIPDVTFTRNHLVITEEDYDFFEKEVLWERES
jgi:hypothetical protein